ncbi:GrpB family protein [Deinococcus sp. SM5_A1]|uniref:GrpB family protein n=1 Tax=Deinococcus sp. SM5_A1 TaxID=3379094 RepID=UPI00385E463E
MQRDREGLVQPHDPQWAQRAATELDILRRTTGPAISAAEHFGSTAVPGLVAKPTIDLTLATALWPWPEELDGKLQSIGFHFYKAPNPRWRVYLKAWNGRRRGFHLHIVEEGSAHWQEHLLFRDHLRQHPADAAAYGQLKLELAATHPDRLGEYQAGKAQLVREIMGRAKG